MENFEPFGGTHLVVTLQTNLQEEEKLHVSPKRKGSEPNLGDTIFDAARLNLCQSAVRARLKQDFKLAIFLTPSSGATLMRAQRVALCLFSFCAKDNSPTALVQPSASLLWQPTTCQTLLQSQRCTDVELDLCEFGHNMRRPTRVLLANVGPCDAESLRRTCHGVDFVCSRSGTALRTTSDAIPSQLPADFGHYMVPTLLAGLLQPSHLLKPAHENITFGMIWGAGASLF